MCALTLCLVLCDSPDTSAMRIDGDGEDDDKQKSSRMTSCCLFILHDVLTIRAMMRGAETAEAAKYKHAEQKDDGHDDGNDGEDD